MLNVVVALTDREILSAGSIVLGKDQSSFSITIESLKAEFSFVEGTGQPAATAELIDGIAKTKFTGFNNPLGTAYELPSFMNADGKSIGLALVIHTISSGSDGSASPLRLVNYTVTARAS